MQNAPKKLRTFAPEIAALIGSIRRRIRWLVLLEGLGWAIFAGIVLFWISWCLDYLPVRFGYSELSRSSRIVALTITGLAVGWIFYQFVLRRIFVRFSDKGIAVLIERRYPQFSDGLITAVDQNAKQSSDSKDGGTFDIELLQRTLEDAEKKAAEVDRKQIVRSQPAKWAIGFAGLGVVSVIVGLLGSFDSITLGAKRLYLLSEQAWPRQCELELVGLTIKRETSIPGIVELERMVKPVDGKLYVGRGSSVSMVVHGREGTAGGNVSLPETCWLNFDRPDGSGRGSQSFRRVGAANQGVQTYVLDGAPLDNLMTGMNFVVSGGDDRTQSFSIVVVDEPTVKTTDLACTFPRYMVDEASGRFTQRSIRWTGEAKLPQGTQVEIEVVTKDPLSKVYVSQAAVADVPTSSSGEEPEEFKVIPVTGNQFRCKLDALDQTTRFKFYLCDAFGVVGTEPHQVVLQPITDRPPMVETALHGIGTAVTPDVQIPIKATVQDDYGVDEVWIEVEHGPVQLKESGLQLSTSNQLEATLDFRARRESDARYRLTPGEGASMSLVVAASDRFDLQESPNMGVGDRLQFDIVSPDELLRILERLEVGQRRRLEQVLRELRELKKYLQRTQSKTELGESFVEPGDESAAASAPENQDERELELRRLFAQRALLQMEKSQNEIRGSARAFDDLRLQVINNRIVGTNREQRFSEQIIGPLNEIADQTFVQLADQANALEQLLQQLESGQMVTDNGVIELTEQLRRQQEQEASLASQEALESAATAITQLSRVLNLLIKFETQNELLDIVRRMIQQQEALLKRTRQQRQKQAFEGLLD